MAWFVLGSLLRNLLLMASLRSTSPGLVADLTYQRSAPLQFLSRSHEIRMLDTMTVVIAGRFGSPAPTEMLTGAEP